MIYWLCFWKVTSLRKRRAERLNEFDSWSRASDVCFPLSSGWVGSIAAGSTLLGMDGASVKCATVFHLAVLLLHAYVLCLWV